MMILTGTTLGGVTVHGGLSPSAGRGQVHAFGPRAGWQHSAVWPKNGPVPGRPVNGYLDGTILAGMDTIGIVEFRVVPDPSPLALLAVSLLGLFTSAWRGTK